MKKIIVYSIVILLVSGCGVHANRGIVITDTEEHGEYTSYHGVSISQPRLSEVSWVDSQRKYQVGDTVWIMKK